MISDEHGLCISQRSLTVSTCGIVPGILRLAEEQLAITLAISLHAPNDELRKTMMPIANAYTIKEILEACRVYYEKTGRRLTFEYSLVKGVNDGKSQAQELSRLLKNFNCHVNLIPVNPIKERKFEQSDGQNVQEFKKLLEKNGINATIRREMGRDIDGACGQLRKRHKDQSSQ
jgi:23S rRNA (adenine2503-C2)-methyltransferase